MRGFVRCLPLAALLLLGGCATGGIAMQTTVHGGERVKVSFQKGSPEMQSEDGVQINEATFSMTPDKKVQHVFSFTDARKRPLTRVQVEDVSDEALIPLVDDAAPKLSAAGQWRVEVAPAEWKDPRITWLATVSNTLRVYRFTLTFADGRRLVIHQGAYFPAPMKVLVRQAMGQTY